MDSLLKMLVTAIERGQISLVGVSPDDETKVNGSALYEGEVTNNEGTHQVRIEIHTTK